MIYENDVIRCELKDEIALVWIDNPPMNPLNEQAIDGLRDCFNILQELDTVRCVIITGEGEKAFVAGADISQFPQWTPDIAEDATEKGQRIFCKIENFRTPVIAAINGFALGGGLELALACDMRLASENARMGLPEVSLGIIPGYGGTQRLCRHVNVGEAKKMIYTASPIKAEKALEIGLIQGIWPQELLLDKAMELAKKITANGPLAVGMAKQAIGYQRKCEINQGLAVELQAQRELFKTEDHLEGITAFLEKRKGEFKGR